LGEGVTGFCTPVPGLTFTVKGGFLTYTANNLDAVNAATAKFCAEVTDPKAAIITAYNFVFGQVRWSIVVENLPNSLLLLPAGCIPTHFL
jgi:hypothetical protein